MTTTPKARVTDKDREAAQSLWNFIVEHGPVIDRPAGKAIGQQFLDAFAAHRTAAIEEAVKTVCKVVYADRTNVPRGELDLAVAIIDAIRALTPHRETQAEQEE